eukprot:scaffold16767_cov149-Skeletonema_dohrnii-CCMP3373.AAC.2
MVELAAVSDLQSLQILCVVCGTPPCMDGMCAKRNCLPWMDGIEKQPGWHRNCLRTFEWRRSDARRFTWLVNVSP